VALSKEGAVTQEGAVAPSVDRAPVACTIRQQFIALVVAIFGSVLGSIDGTIVAIFFQQYRWCGPLSVMVVS
jgi:hypothetical protein